MSQVLWFPPEELSSEEEKICARLKRVGRFFVFLRKWRHRLFDESFQQELAGMYSDKPRGNEPRPPALLALVVLLQAFEGKSDAGAVEEAAFDRRWQMVLDCLGCDSPPFSQGTLVDFRQRLIDKDMDKRLLQRTVELAKETGDFGYRQLRVALDSAPLWGAGRVEDTFNLIGRAMNIVVQCAAEATASTPAQVRKAADMQLLGERSIKAELDVDWSDSLQQNEALQRLLDDVERLQSWIRKTLANKMRQPPLKGALELLAQVVAQDLEPDPSGGGKRIKRGTTKNRRISIHDPDMRHGRKSKSRVINGYKRHIAKDLDTGYVIAVAVRPANEKEHRGMEDMKEEILEHAEIDELHIDRGYLAGDWTSELYRQGKTVVSKAWFRRREGMYCKVDFKIDLERQLVCCPAGEIAPIQGNSSQFSRKACRECTSRSKCTKRKDGQPKVLYIHELEALLIKLRDMGLTEDGRQRQRERVSVEHGLAHLCRRQGRKARYRGQRKNLLDLRRNAAVQNLFHLDRQLREAA